MYNISESSEVVEVTVGQSIQVDQPSPSIREISRRLLAAETAGAVNGAHEAELVCEKLRIALTRFAGADGFVALMRRSLSLAKAEVPALARVELRPDGCFDGFSEAVRGNGNEAGSTLTAHFLWLLVTFVGEPLAFRLVSEAWPEVVLED